MDDCAYMRYNTVMKSHILIIEDDQNLSNLIKESLEAKNFEVTEKEPGLTGAVKSLFSPKKKATNL